MRVRPSPEGCRAEHTAVAPGPKRLGFFSNFSLTEGIPMFYERLAMKALLMLGCILFVFGGTAAYGSGMGNIAIGKALPGFSLQAPTSSDEKAYLGLEKTSSFTLSQIRGKIVCIELMSVF
jgi:hypothetical protein